MSSAPRSSEGAGNLHNVISPDVSSAVANLERKGILSGEQALLFGRIARGELVSLAGALQALLYLGVLSLTTGVGLLFRDKIANLGPLTIAFAVGLAPFGSLDRLALLAAPSVGARLDLLASLLLDLELVLVSRLERG